jgi:2-(1,2-epoxy-1,2-dihydrophenyl)acetyl-CoA isomerase
MTATATDEDLLVTKAAGVLTLTLNRPKVLNSLTLAMLKTISEQLKAAEKDPEIRCVILTGAGRAFCAGADLGDLSKRKREADFSLGDELRRHFNPLAAQIRKLEKPVIGAVNGLAAGAGASLILSCDLKVCAEGASFICAFVRVGLVPDTGLTHLLPRAMGLSKALEHAWTAKPITAAEALAAGLVNKVVPEYRLETETLELAKALTSAPPRAIALTKRALNRAVGTQLEDQMEYEAQLQEILGRTKDHAEGVAAFLEKRPPQFLGE